VRHTFSDDEVGEQKRVDQIAQSLLAHLDARQEAISAVHIHRAQSSAVQKIVSELLKAELGFSEEVVLPPQLGFITSVRPDFYFDLSEGRGILAEVERGGTTTNNHDLKDFWKAHIAPHAHHLFLIVPNANWNEAGAARERPFQRVERRLAAFFGDSRREVDVLSAHIFGYGEGGSARPI
jgi:hypothetical protein